MKNQFYTNIKYLTIVFITFLVFVPDIFAQGPPPPPAVPFDFGISAFIVACVGYGAYKLKGKKE